MAAAEFLYGRITVRRSLALVTSVAGQLVEATASTAGEVTEQVLARLVAQFDLDYSFLRRNDHETRASIHVAKWPPRLDVPDGPRSPERHPLQQHRSAVPTRRARTIWQSSAQSSDWPRHSICNWWPRASKRLMPHSP